MTRISTGKWQKYNCLQQDHDLVEYLPETAILTEHSLSGFLEKYKKVVLKPNGGAGGEGIMVARMTETNNYELQSLRKKRLFLSTQKLYQYLKRNISMSRYIIQQFVSLAKVYGRLFDLRVMVQRGVSNDWEYTGGLAKVAYRGMKVTNPEEYVAPIDEALRDSTQQNRQTVELFQEIRKVCLRSSQQLSKQYTDLSIIGFDIGVDIKGNVWIIEPNFVPAIYWFKQLPERQTYQRIVAYKRKYRANKPNQERFFTKESEDEYYYYN